MYTPGAATAPATYTTVEVDSVVLDGDVALTEPVGDDVDVVANGR